MRVLGQWTLLRGARPGNGNVALQKEGSVLICQEETIKKWQRNNDILSAPSGKESS